MLNGTGLTSVSGPLGLFRPKPEVAVAEARRNATRGVRGFDVANRPDMTPLWDPFWEPLWQFAHETAIPLHFHTIGGRSPDTSKMPAYVVRRVQAAHITNFQMHMSYMLMSLIYSGAPERYPNLKIVIGEAGLGWIPYVLQHMDLEWEDQFKDLGLSMRPSDGRSSGTPSPRNERPASARIAPATPNAAATVTGINAFGRMWRASTRSGGRPRPFAARTKLWPR